MFVAYVSEERQRLCQLHLGVGGGDEGTRLPCEAYWGAARRTLTPEGFPAPPPLPSKFLPVHGEFRLWSLDCFRLCIIKVKLTCSGKVASAENKPCLIQNLTRPNAGPSGSLRGPCGGSSLTNPSRQRRTCWHFLHPFMRWKEARREGGREGGRKLLPLTEF